MRIPSFARPALAALALITLGTVPVPAEGDAELFDAGTVQEIRLTISTRDLQQLRDRYEDNTYYAADFAWRDTKIRNVGIRSRGRASRSPQKPGIQVDFNRYITGQRFVGLKALVLDNLWQDPSMVREKVTMTFFSRMGLPAPRVAYARLFINNEYQGLYGLVEAVDSAFLNRVFGESKGFLFEYKQVSSYTGAYLGEELDPYKRLFEPRTNEKQPDSILYAPLRDLFREISQPRSTQWRDRVDDYVDLEQLANYVALEAYLAEDDGFLGANGMSNFYVYRTEESTVHRLIPWDKDLTFKNAEASVLTRVEENELFRRLMAFRAYRHLYYEAVEKTAKSAREDAWLRKAIAQNAALIAEAAYSDPGKPYSNEEFDAAVRSLKQFARTRPEFVLKELHEIRRDWKPGSWERQEPPQ